jgi:hypothetical protein
MLPASSFATLKNYKTYSLTMQRITATLWAILLVFLLFSCKKNTDPQPEPDQFKPVGEATSVGTPDNESISQKIIGVEGGSISSSDGRLKQTIPAGTFSSDQQVSIQSISNHNP